jgi:hypothetical protein
MNDPKEKMFCYCCECHQKMEVFFLAKDYSNVTCDECCYGREDVVYDE